MERSNAMSPIEQDAQESAPYTEAIGQLLTAAERTRDPGAWLTLTTLAEMFVRLERRHQANVTESRVGPVGLYPAPGAKTLS